LLNFLGFALAGTNERVSSTDYAFIVFRPLEANWPKNSFYLSSVEAQLLAFPPTQMYMLERRGHCVQNDRHFLNICLFSSVTRYLFFARVGHGPKFHGEKIWK
jgi:hypothetical protein